MPVGQQIPVRLRHQVVRDPLQRVSPPLGLPPRRLAIDSWAHAGATGAARRCGGGHEDEVIVPRRDALAVAGSRHRNWVQLLSGQSMDSICSLAGVTCCVHCSSYQKLALERRLILCRDERDGTSFTRSISQQTQLNVAADAVVN